MSAVLHLHRLFTLPLWLLATSSVSRVAADRLGNLWLYGLLRFLHLGGMAGFVGLVALLDLRGLGLFPPGSLDPARGRIGLILQGCFRLTITTGVLLFLRDPLAIGLHSMFLPKMLLIVLGYVHARVVERLPAVRSRPLAKRLAAGASLAIWLLVIGASTWNRVEPPVNVAAALRAADLGHS